VDGVPFVLYTVFIDGNKAALLKRNIIMTKFNTLKAELFNLLLVKYKEDMNPQAAATFAVEGFISYYKNASTQEQIACIKMDIEDVRGAS